jgi:membrane-bound lytic murein transglycosylase A
MAKTVYITIFVVLYGLLSSCSVRSRPDRDQGQGPLTHEGGTYTTPTELVPLEEVPTFLDDLNFDNMIEAIELQLARYKQKDLSGTIKFGDDTYPLTAAVASLTLMRKQIFRAKECQRNKSSEECLQEFQDAMVKDFAIYRPQKLEGVPQEAFFTGYYTPTLRGAFSPTEEFPYAIYALPEKPELVELPRSEIDFRGGLVGEGYELFFTGDLFELYLLHVEGGGAVRVEDAESGKSTIHYISYAGTNKQRFSFISKYMVSKGYLQEGQTSIQRQRDFFRANPDKREEILSSCEGYIYFKRTETPPLGSDEVPLTDNRSLATDRKRYKFKGLLTFVDSERPIQDEQSGEGVATQPFSRFFLDQDTGGAIRGDARADLYFGRDAYAKFAAENMRGYGQIYFLMARKK